MYILYLASSAFFRALSFGKIGCTEEPHGRRSTYLTGCPPGLTPSHDIDYEGMWETPATTTEELRMLEEEAHDYFLKYRMVRNIPGDSEWFDFKGQDQLTLVKAFMESRSYRQIALSEITRPKQIVGRCYNKNLQYYKRTDTERSSALREIQEPWIAAVRAFLTDPSQQAGKVEAPCGSGKTRTTCESIHGIIHRLILCAPSESILNQWKRTLLVSESAILLIGANGTTSASRIYDHVQRDRYCILVTNKSAHLLLDHLHTADLVVFDEAHHMAGKVAEDDVEGTGETRRLLAKAVSLGKKRLFLTFTPRDICSADGTAKVFSMNDTTVFGSTIFTVGLRTLIRKGVLPAYNIWPIYDAEHLGEGMEAMAKLLSTAWRCTEMRRGSECHVFNHLIVYAADTTKGRELQTHLQTLEPDTCVQFIQGGDDVSAAIESFSSAPRAILVNCMVLGEGVDVPCADSVAITYPKYARGAIVQMLLRPGRWFPGKSVFHILLPSLATQDMSGFNDVLAGLASVDEALRDEILYAEPSTSGPSDKPSGPPLNQSEDRDPACIQWQIYEGHDLEQVKAAFASLRRTLLSTRGGLRQLQHNCRLLGITSSLQYEQVSATNGWPDDPRIIGTTWYDFFHPDEVRMTVTEFANNCLTPNAIRSAEDYSIWRTAHPECPSIQHINDGYFGAQNTNFTVLLESAAPVARRRR